MSAPGEPGLRKPRAGRLRAWAELTRVSNLPTIVSNVTVGVAIGAAVAGDAAGGSTIDPAGATEVRLMVGAAVALVAVGLIYLGGVILNDVCDAEIDRAQRPGRPIPSGRVALAAARRAAVGALVGGPLLLLSCNGTAALLGAGLSLLVVLYNLIHVRRGISVLVMGLCRGMVYPVACAAVIASPRSVGVAAGLGLLPAVYTALFSMVARGEAGGRLVRWPALVIPLWLVPAGATAYAVRPVDASAWTWAACAGLLSIAWTARAARLVYGRPPRVVPAVVSWLAGLCLIDAFVLAFIAPAWVALVSGGCFLATVAAQRRVLGT